MSLRRYLIILGICTAFCWLAWLLVVLLLSPATGLLAMFLFYATFFFALVGTMVLIIFPLRSFWKKGELDHYRMRVAWRQAILFSVFYLVALSLQSQRYLTWWNFIILIFLTWCVGILIAPKKKI